MNVNLTIIFRLFICSFLLLILPIVSKAKSETKSAELKDKIVAVVNNDVITQQELDRRVAIMKRQLGSGNNTLQDEVKLRQKVLDNFIDVLLQLQMAKKSGIEISDKELDGVIVNIAKSNNMTVAKLKEVLPEQEGMSFAGFCAQLREQGIITRIQQHIFGRDINISDEEVNTFLRNPPQMSEAPSQYHVVDILFEVQEGEAKEPTVATEALAKKMLTKLQGNGKVEEVIQENQGNFKGKIKSEDLGWRKLNEFPELFIKEIAKMKVNQTIGPIMAPNGVHLLKLLAINHPAVSAKFTKDQAHDYIFRRKLSEKLEPWLKELREKAYILRVK